MRKILLWALLAFMFLPLFIYAQSNYRPGYIIKSNGDTVKGYINYREWNRSPKTIEFKQSLNDKSSIAFDASALRSFQVNDLDNYVSYIGPLSISKTHLSELSDYLDTAKRGDEVFLKVLSKGKNVILLQHEDEVKQRYFVAENGLGTVELLYYQYNDNNKVTTYAPFRKQLVLLLQKYATADQDRVLEVSKASYNESTLIKYVQIINGNTDVSNSHAATKSKTLVHPFIGVGLALTQSTFSGPPDFNFPQPASQLVVSPVINVGVNIFHDNEFQNYFFNINASFFNVSQTAKGEVANYTFKKSLLNISPEIIYNVYNTRPLKIFIGGGVGLYHSTTLSSKITITKSGTAVNYRQVKDPVETDATLDAGASLDHPFELREDFIDLQFKTGIIINKSIELYFSTSPSAWKILNRVFTPLQGAHHFLA